MKFPCIIITIKGAVQGVGFRPFVYRTALARGVRGWVRNDALGVVVRAVGARENLEAFLNSLQTTPPPLAIVRSFEIREDAPQELPESFAIVESAQGERLEADVARDSAVCEACLAEMRDAGNRRFRHPFINCTDCGPRFTIIEKLPYDRPATTMAAFTMCKECKKEYESPGDRRFHAQPISCPSCGPALSLLDGEGNAIVASDPLKKCVALLERGAIVAVKGLGGFHLACRADDAGAVARLRLRKMREEKPLAIMVRDLSVARRFAEMGAEEKSLLESCERPIVVCGKKNVSGLAANIAPGLPTLGVLLPYTPMHHLLFIDGRFDALVMTSGNVTDEPIAYTNDGALTRLKGIADAFLTHDRDIHVRNDDSIVRVLDGKPMLLRRSRGYVPDPLPAPCDVHGCVALGGVLKSTVAVGRARMCYLSQYVGAVATVEAVEGLWRLIHHLLRVLDVSPRCYVGDMHPQTLMRPAGSGRQLPYSKVQHHHAHAVACMAENEVRGNAVCVVYDGTGYGLDGCVWGGELLLAGNSDFTRIGHLAYMPLPGAEAAIRSPGRMALAALFTKMGDEAAVACPWMPDEEKEATLAMVRSNANCIPTSSMGRLFDAVSAMLGICKKRTYEGQPAIELEGRAAIEETGEYDPLVAATDAGVIIDGAGILMQAYLDFKAGATVQRVAGRFHSTIARATAEAVRMAADITGCVDVCLSGGCFQNALLLTRIVRNLKSAGLTPSIHRRLPPNDECVSYGQLVIAGARRMESR